jgi:hypothetical protein
MVRLDLRDRAGEKIKDGRHVGLDFYDLLIEVFDVPATGFNTEGRELKIERPSPVAFAENEVKRAAGEMRSCWPI